MAKKKYPDLNLFANTEHEQKLQFADPPIITSNMVALPIDGMEIRVKKSRVKDKHTTTEWEEIKLNDRASKFIEGMPIKEFFTLIKKIIE